MKHKTLKELNLTIWYRLLKTIYVVFCFSLFLSMSIALLMATEGALIFIIILWLYVLFGIEELIRRSFYYVVLNNFWPDKEYYSEPIKNRGIFLGYYSNFITQGQKYYLKVGGKILFYHVVLAIIAVVLFYLLEHFYAYFY